MQNKEVGKLGFRFLLEKSVSNFDNHEILSCICEASEISNALKILIKAMLSIDFLTMKS